MGEAAAVLVGRVPPEPVPRDCLEHGFLLALMSRNMSRDAVVRLVYYLMSSVHVLEGSPVCLASGVLEGYVLRVHTTVHPNYRDATQ